ncbi:MAG: hypothetical protein A2X86_20750 [Bdellovibrionales bacterium GWA2_49_15]|nr:MAG: hypothetical protein A2X86_20750 [Bdellovibrionales bacterium GWA2_49_15]HAZ11254.1 hypothetical protein [Bdellovibrionales bacterium]
MSDRHLPTPALIFFSILYRRTMIDVSDIESKLTQNFAAQIGPLSSYFHAHCPMKRYYAKEMGPEEELERIFYFSQHPVARDKLVTLKLAAFRLEEEWMRSSEDHSARTVNIDVGIVTLENLVLATGKMFTHRLYLGQGVCGDLTLIYQNDSFQPLPWTYPDYAHAEIRTFFAWMRKILHLNLLQGLQPL